MNKSYKKHQKLFLKHKKCIELFYSLSGLIHAFLEPSLNLKTYLLCWRQALGMLRWMATTSFFLLKFSVESACRAYPWNKMRTPINDWKKLDSFGISDRKRLVVSLKFVRFDLSRRLCVNQFLKSTCSELMSGAAPFLLWGIFWSSPVVDAHRASLSLCASLSRSTRIVTDQRGRTDAH